MPNISDDISSEITAQTVNIVRAAVGLTKPVLDALNELEKELLSDLNDVVGKTDFTVGRLRALLTQTRETIQQAYAGIAVANKDGLVTVAGIAARQSLGAVNQAIGVKLASVEWSKEQLEAIALKTVVRGNFYTDWWLKQGEDTRHRFEREMRVGQLRGETVDQLARRVRGKRELGYKDGLMQVSRNQAQALVRTSALGVSNAARMAAYAANDEVIKGVQWVSTLDGRTTPQCIALDGKRWDFPKGDGNANYADYRAIGHDKKFEPPPIHWNCRSTVIPITYSWKELAGEHGNSKAAAIADRVPRETRASMDGQVARTKTFSEWLEGKPKEFQDEVLGPIRAEAWRQGQLNLTGLTDQNNNPLTLAQLGIPRAPLEPKLPIPSPETPSPASGQPPETPSGPPPAPEQLAKLQAAVDSAERKLAAVKAALPPPPAIVPIFRADLLDRVFGAINNKDDLFKAAGARLQLAKTDADIKVIRAALIKREAQLADLVAKGKLPLPAPSDFRAAMKNVAADLEAARVAKRVEAEAERAAKFAAEPKLSTMSKQKLSSETSIASTKRNYESSGITESHVVKFTDGNRAIFKPAPGWENEVAASHIADMLKLDDLVPATIEKTLSVGKSPTGLPMVPRKGSLQAFVERSTPAGDMANRYKAFDGSKDAARAAAWDYFIGNLDRHHFNWMVQDGKLALIDHGQSISRASTGSFRSNLVRWAQGKSTILSVQNPQGALSIPSEVAGWLAKWPEIEAYLRQQFGKEMDLPIPGGLTIMSAMKKRLEELVMTGARPAGTNTFAYLTERFRE